MAYEGFKKLKASLSKEKGIKDAGAVAASIGMKKFGKKKFEKAAHEGKSLEHSKPKKSFGM
jgi:hypothetical protein